MAKLKKESNDILSNDIDTSFYEDLNKTLSREYTINDNEVLDRAKQFVSTGSILLDTIISNEEKGGFPVGTCSMIVGEPSSGKSLIASHALKATQEMGGVAVYLDIERSADKNFLRRIGVDTDRLIYRQPDTIEQMFQMAETIIKKTIEKNGGKKSDKVITIIWDSVAGGRTSDEQDMEYGDKKYASQAGIISTSLRKISPLLKQANVCFIMVNQLRVNMQRQNVYQDQYMIPGGEAPKFWSSVILRLKRKSKIEVEKMIIGYETQVKVTKNKISGDGRVCNFDIFFNRGIDDSQHILDLLKERGHEKFEEINTQRCKLILEDGKEIEFKRKEWEALYNEHKTYVNKLVTEALIIDLSNPNLEINRVEDKDVDIEENIYSKVNKKTGEIEE